MYDDDAAAGVDSKENAKMMDMLLDILPCRLAGGFTTNERVYDWLDKGASQVVVEYAASNLGFLDGVPKVCPRLPNIPCGPVTWRQCKQGARGALSIMMWWNNCCKRPRPSALGSGSTSLKTPTPPYLTPHPEGQGFVWRLHLAHCSALGRSESRLPSL